MNANLTTTDASKQLNVNQSRVRQLVRAGRLPRRYVMGKLVFTQAEVDLALKHRGKKNFQNSGKKTKRSLD